MAQTVKIRRGTKAELVARGALLTGEMGFCTDTKEVYVGDGTNNLFVGRVMTGPYASRPSAAVSGRFYYVTSGTNVGYLYMDDGTTWVRMNALALTDLTGTLDNITDGATYGKVKNSELTSGQVNRISDGTNTATAAQVSTHIADSTKHRQINDVGAASTDLWSAQKIKNEIELAKHNIEPQASVKDRDITAPPGSPALADRYIIPSSATGVWASQTNKIAEWNGTAWDLYTASIGWTCYVDDEQKIYSWNGSAWVRTGGALQTITAGAGLTGGGQADTVTIDIGAGNGISVAADSISVVAFKGITVNSSGVAANIDGDSIIYDAANGNRLMVNTIDGGTF
ncbi:DUF2793 domain-containing protein [Paenibacillus sp. 2RAB27]|uniref:DUF2793 domain-containing protein n=1 Tax=Paenibacillus sp. 2RAB27 TaxID=3232991 RepID=UPI003F9D6071